jgi:hypothetical protein
MQAHKPGWPICRRIETRLFRLWLTRLHLSMNTRFALDGERAGRGFDLLAIRRGPSALLSGEKFRCVRNRTNSVLDFVCQVVSLMFGTQHAAGLLQVRETANRSEGGIYSLGRSRLLSLLRRLRC